MFGDEELHVGSPYSGGGLFSLLPPAEGSPSELQLERMASGTPTADEGGGGDHDHGSGTGAGMSRCSSGDLQCAPSPGSAPGSAHLARSPTKIPFPRPLQQAPECELYPKT